jgi:hypothetical protein
MDEETRVALQELNAATGLDLGPTVNVEQRELKGYHEGSKVYLDSDQLRSMARCAETVAKWLDERAKQQTEGDDV